MEWNTVERAIKLEIDRESSEQARLVYVFGINHNIPTTWRWAREDDFHRHHHPLPLSLSLFFDVTIIMLSSSLSSSSSSSSLLLLLMIIIIFTLNTSTRRRPPMTTTTASTAQWRQRRAVLTVVGERGAGVFGNGSALVVHALHTATTVSYTHLTLPTRRTV